MLETNRDLANGCREFLCGELGLTGAQASAASEIHPARPTERIIDRVPEEGLKAIWPAASTTARPRAAAANRRDTLEFPQTSFPIVPAFRRVCCIPSARNRQEEFGLVGTTCCHVVGSSRTCRLRRPTACWPAVRSPALGDYFREIRGHLSGSCFGGRRPMGDAISGY